MFLWAFGFPATHVLIGERMIDPITMGMLQFSFAAVLFFIIGACLKIKGLFSLTKSELWRFAALGFVGMTMMETCLLYAQKKLSTINAAMMEAEAPFIIGLIGLFVMRKVSPAQFFGLIAGFVGCLAVTGVLTPRGLMFDKLSFGDFLILASSFCWAVYTILGTSVIHEVGAYKFTAWTMLFGALFLFAVFLITYGPETIIPPPSDIFAWGLIAYYVLFATVLAFFSWNQAQHYISVVLLSMSEYLTPFLSGLIAWAWLNEKMTVWQIVGAVVIGAAIFIDPEVTEIISSRRKIKKETL